jgi:alanine dehydrogenase
MLNKTIILNKSHVEELIKMEEVIKSVETAFTEEANCNIDMPAKKYLYFNQDNGKSPGDLRIMPCSVIGSIAGVKAVNVHPDNPEKFNLPTVMAVIELIDPDNGYPLAIMDGTSITNMRTGAAAGLATKYLARKNSENVGLVGSGVQALLSFFALNEVMKIKEIKISSRTLESRENLARMIRDNYGIDAIAVETVEEAVTGMDVVTTTTPSRTPLVLSKWVDEGTHINAMGADAPGKQELETLLISRSNLIIDDWEQASHSGEINVPLSEGILGKGDIHAKLGDVIIGNIMGRSSDDEITVFDSTGLAVQDIATAWKVYEKAIKMGIGHKIDLMA